MSRALRLAVLALCLGGCSSESAADRTAAPHPSSADASGEARWGPDDAWTVARDPGRVIGVRDGNEEYQFSDISAAARQTDGDLVVADGGAGSVRLYGADGVFKRRLGGPGAGPGEFQDPTQVAILEADSIFVWDDLAYRLTTFDSAGEFVGVHDLSRERIAGSLAPPVYPGSARLLSREAFLVRLVEKSQDPPVEGSSRSRSGALRVTAAGDVVDTIMLFGDVERVSVDSPWGPLRLIPPLARTTSIALQPRRARACIGDQVRTEAVCFDAAGSSRIVRWTAPPIPSRVDEPMVVAWRHATTELYGQKLSPVEARAITSQVPVPSEHPPYSDLLLDAAGNLWVKRGPTPSRGSEVTEYLVFDEAGGFLGPVAVAPVRVLEIGADDLIGVYQDALGIQYIQVFEISKPEANPEAAPMP